MEEGSRASASCASALRSLGAGLSTSGAECALERELRDIHRSLSSAGPTATPSTSIAFIEGPVVVELDRIDVVLPTPTDLAVCPSSSPLTLSAISLSASGSDIGEHPVYPRLKDRLSPLRSQFQSLEDFLWFQVEKDLESSEPS